MARYGSAAEFESDGTSALERVGGSRLVLIDGGLSATLIATRPTQACHVEPTRHLTPVQNVVIGIAILACVLAGLYVMARVDFSNRASVSRAAQSVEMSQVVVTPGDSLWNIAQEHEVEGLTTQQTVDLILSTNALSSSTLGVGQTLLVPVE